MNLHHVRVPKVSKQVKKRLCNRGYEVNRTLESAENVLLPPLPQPLMATYTGRTTRIWIDQPRESGCKLAGDLEHFEVEGTPDGEISNKNGRFLVLVSDSDAVHPIPSSTVVQILHGTMGYVFGVLISLEMIDGM